MDDRPETLNTPTLSQLGHIEVALRVDGEAVTLGN